MQLETFLNDNLYDAVWADEQQRRQSEPTGPSSSGLSDIDRLERQVEKLRLVCRALSEILVSIRKSECMRATH
ncbi:MAG: hypothetical protein O2820_00715 [Planctomycetota bacterium]|nr:hypothetical protein [Planctomycetota bacterium]MDA1247717.1 hypothetical protein [Planctomycetota bacterium]